MVSDLACCLVVDLLDDGFGAEAVGFADFESDDSFALTLARIEGFVGDGLCCSALAAAISSSDSTSKKLQLAYMSCRHFARRPEANSSPSS